MNFLAQAFVLSWLPGLFWLAYVESRSPQPLIWSRLVLTFLAGGLSVFGVQLFHMVYDPVQPESLLGSLVFFCVIVGGLEESCKMLAVLVAGWPRRDFREAWDGVGCASAAALGFATAENFHYVMNYQDAGVLLSRSLSATFAHVAMSGIWGFALGLRKQSGGRVSPQGRGAGWGTVLEALVWAAIFHGLYDWCLTQGWPWAALLVFGGLVIIFRQRLQESYFTSSRRQTSSQLVRECRACHGLGRSEYRYCPQCGEQDWDEKRLCLACLKECAEGDRCSHCQRLLV
ncbi:MAG: PrsW family intramembrane metalloprotease [Candidatus Eremiobacteraeota bacterium]|nr:PrsW family intramembrane metalloprotease [Candidatus Eremiobacteraeota bacterium]MCW5866804.1 PrsW family intramembrane metalloprotease [Candidatus Eremiobacteraeota bacterium]